MIGRMLRGIWTHLLITFSNDYTSEGFEKTNKKFELPANLIELDSATKRKLTICNLFANQNLSIFEIVRILDTSLHQVVPTLIENGLIKERRRMNRGAAPTNGGRNTLSILPEEPKTTGELMEPAERSNAANACSTEETTSKAASHTLVDFAQSDRRRVS